MVTTSQQHQKANERPRSRYIPALDGIRTLAVAAVVLYHLNPSLIPGGMQGVTVFFVLSGYLITHLLLTEYGGTGRIDLKAFWVRRLRRLVPATVAVVIGVAALCTFFNHVMLTKMRGDIVPSLLYLNNWWQIFNNVSYFNNVGDPSPLTHFWSLAIEAQFYVVWPATLLVALKTGQSRTRIRRAVLALALVSAVEMAILYNPALDPSRVYYGTDTRAFSLLIGAWLAFVPLNRLPELAHRALARISAGSTSSKHAGPRRTGAARAQAPTMRSARPERATARMNGNPSATAPGAPGAPNPLNAPAPLASSASALQASHASMCYDALGLIGLAGTLLLVAFSNGYTAFPYRGGILLASVFAAMLVASCAAPQSHVAKLFELKPLVWLGQRSYSIYLWHFPLLVLMNPASDVTERPWWIHLAQVALVVAVSAACYRFIETPFRHGALGKLVACVRGNRTELVTWAKRNAVLVAACSLVGIAALGGLIFVPPTSALSEEGAAMLEGDGAHASSGNAAANSEDKPANGEVKLNASGFPEGSFDITMIGDSVSLRVVDVFNQTFPHGTIDAAMSRQFFAGVDVYRSLLDQNLCGRVAVFALGTNGLVTDDVIDELMTLVGNKRIAVFVNNRCPSAAWIQANNDAFNRALGRHKNLRVIDWYGYSANRNELFDGDGTHLSEQGAQEYVQLIHDAVKNYLPVHLEDGTDPRLLSAQRALDALKAAATPKLSSIKLDAEK